MPGQFELTQAELRLILTTDASQLEPWKRQIKDALQGAQQQATQASQAIQNAAKGGLAPIPGDDARKAADYLRSVDRAVSDLHATTMRTNPEYAKMIQNLDDSERSASKASSTFSQFARGIASQVGGFSLLAGGAVIAGREITQFVSDSVDAYRELEKEVTNISTIQPEVDTTKLYAQLSDLQTRVPATSRELANSYYQIASSIQLSQEDTLSLVTKSAQGARAALSDQEKWATAVTAILNTYGKQVQDVNHIQDVFFLTVKNGVITGDQLAGSFSPVAQAAREVGQSFELAAASAAAITKEGGNVDANMTRLKDVFENLGTEKARKGLSDLGIQVTDNAGNFRSLIDILTDLQAKLQGLPEGARNQILGTIFEDKRAREGLAILLNELPNLREYLKQNQEQSGEAEKAISKMMDTGAAKAEHYKNVLQQVKETLGQFLDLEHDYVQFSSSDLSANIAQTMTLISNLGDVPQLRANNPLFSFAGGINDLARLFGIDPHASTPLPPPRVETRFAESRDTFSGAPEKYLQSVQQAQSGTDTAMRGLDASVQEGLKLASQSFLEAKIGPDEYQKTVNQAKNSIDLSLQQAQDAIANYAASVDGDLSVAGDRGEKHLLRLIDAFNKAKAAADNAKSALDSSVLTQAQLDVQAQTQSNVQSAQVSRAQANDPAYIKSVIDLQKQQLDTQNAIEEAQKRAGLIPETTRERTQRELELKGQLLPLQKQLSQAQSDYASLQQKDADALQPLLDRERELNDTLKAQQNILSATQTFWDALLEGEQQKIDNLKRQEAQALGNVNPAAPTGLSKQLQDDQTALESYTREANSQLHTLDQTLYDIDRQARETTETMVVGFDAAGKAIYGTVTIAKSMQQALNETSGFNEWTSQAAGAQRALDDLGKRARYMGQEFADAQDSIDKAMQAIDNQFRGPLAEAQAEIDTFNQALQSLGHQEESELRPIDDTIYSLNERLQAANDRLGVLQTRLSALRELDRQAAAEEDLRNRQTGIENIRGRLVGATGAERAGLQDQLNRQQAAQGRAEEENTLQQQIAAQQQVVDSINKQIEGQRRLEEQIRRRYEIEERAIKDNLYNAQQHLDQLNREKKLHEDIQGVRQRQLNQDKQDFERQQELDRRQIQEQLDWAQERANAAKVGVEAVLGVYSGWRAQIQNTRTDDANFFSEHELSMENLVSNDQMNIKAVQNYWGGVVGEQLIVQAMLQSTAQASIKSAKDQVTAINGPGGPLDTLQEQINREKDTATAAEDRSKRTITAINNTITKLQEEAGWIQTINDLNNGVPGAPKPDPSRPSSPPGTVGTKTIGDNFGNAFGIIGGGTPVRTPSAPVGVAASASVGGGQALVINGDAYFEINSPVPTTQAQARQFLSLARTTVQPAPGRARTRAW